MTTPQLATQTRKYICTTHGCPDAQNETQMTYAEIKAHLQDVHHVDTSKEALRNFISCIMFDTVSETHYQWVFDNDVTISQFITSPRSF
jgi:hypothetical protein